MSGRYIELSRNVLVTRHAEQQLFVRYGELVTVLYGFRKELEGVRADLIENKDNHQHLIQVGRFKLVVELMDSYGNRCPEPTNDCYLVIVTVLSPSMKWRGDRSKRLRRRRELA